MDAVTVLIAALAASAIGALFYNLLPVYLGSAQDYRGLDNRAIGFISSAFFFGYNVVTVSAFFWIRRVSWRVVIAVSIPVAIGALLAGTAADAYALLLLTIAIAGGAFAAIYGVGTTILGDTSNPARWYGVKIAIEALVGAVLLLVLPTMVIAKWGFAGANFGLIVATVVLTPFLVWLPARGVKGSREEQGPAEASPPQSPLIWAALFATFLFFSAASAVWAFLERIGANGGHSPAAVGILLSITLVAAVLGSLAAAALGGRFLTARLFIAGGALFVVALVFLNAPLDFTNYAIGACIVTFAIGYMLPIAVTEVAELDSDGRYIVLSVPAIGLGAMAGPAVAGILTQDNAYTPLLAVAAMAILISGILMGIASGRARATR
jgi:predicted MFS family arabinose efflux permease